MCYSLSLISIILLLTSRVCIGRQLTQEDFDDIIGSDYYLFIKYFAPWFVSIYFYLDYQLIQI
jgi:hypothetical protein